MQEAGRDAGLRLARVLRGMFEVWEPRERARGCDKLEGRCWGGEVGASAREGAEGG